ncbi:hypothetical protein GI584_03070 [Gracilibacillus salitolerans]|uniref:Uncharacterized protein n=1 Tax=Gracilibacillus salitolerans TaxID=2663022 RepID=A0A5Q2TGE7_9BACI|nr:hypothetical protein [Gracilibacillus salitolerans]QGH33093.1 hypothetical protein GI584_03070 [Gracilibacillus salitolerans]
MSIEFDYKNNDRSDIEKRSFVCLMDLIERLVIIVDNDYGRFSDEQVKSAIEYLEVIEKSLNPVLKTGKAE